jgi:uncharacterized protein (DUF362 family)
VAKVAITQHADIEPAIHQALDHCEIDDLVRGKLVAVKPNDTWASKTDTTGVTQADTLRAVIQHIKRFGPREIVVTGGAGSAETDEVFRLCGMMKVVQDEGVTFFDHNRPPFTEVALDVGSDPEVHGPRQKIMVNPRVLEYEALVVVSQLKLHQTATVTLALKNIAMSYPAADYYGHPRSKKKHQQCFFDDMHTFIATMAKRFPISLAVTVGHPAMIATGPLMGHAVETGIVIASRDALAADVVGARLLGFDTQAVRHLWEAGRLGLGQTETDAMEFPALGIEDAWARFTEAVYGHKLPFEQP